MRVAGLPPDAQSLIVVAQSARALASSARRAGYAPLAIDLFGDEDTRALSRATIALDSGLSDGLCSAALIDAVRALVRLHHPIGAVYGSGFEHRPEGIAALARELRVYGVDAVALSQAKDPAAVVRACARRHAAHPQVAFAQPENVDGWLAKRRGGSGGGHVRIAEREIATAPGDYYQRRVEGRSVSALFVGDGARATIVGLSEQWASPSSRAPFRYGGAAGPIDFDPDRRKEIEIAVDGMTQEFGLVGLASADFVVSDEVAWLIEVNPRPGATLDIFDCEDDPLLVRHIEACDGRLGTPAARTASKAAEVVYAWRAVACPPRTEWPDWVADRPPARTRFAADDPICTVLATAPDAGAARRLVADRRQEITTMIEGWTT